MIKPEEHLSFHGRDWQVIKAWLLEIKEQKIGLLIQADTHDKSNQIRGSLGLINQMLAFEKAATMAAATKEMK